MDLTDISSLDRAALQRDLRARRLWYHDIEVAPGLRTRFAEDYDACPALRSVDAGNDALEKLLADHLPGDLAGASVLDLGCADGRFCVWAARRGAARVAGVERNRVNLQRARFLAGALELDNLTFHDGSIERHRPMDNFDYIFCLGLLYHLIDPLGTLHALRNQCTRRLVLASAIDLPEGDGEPLSRLDRYATTAHGLWSFNVPMVRQLLTTAGFDIVTEVLTPGSSQTTHYAAIAAPSAAGAHHIFDDSIDQEFPLDLNRRRDKVLNAWQRISQEGCGIVALFGAGTHTPWLLEQTANVAGIQVLCILDDRVPIERTIRGLPIRRPADLDLASVDAVVISSWHQQRAIRLRAEQLFGNRVRIIDLME